MKILWLSHRDPFHPKAGGAERTIAEVASRLSSYGHEITVLSTKWNGSKCLFRMGSVVIRRFGNSFALHLYVPIFTLKYKPDLIINDLGHAVPWPSTTLLGKKSIIFFRHLHARSLPGQVSKILALAITAVERCYFLIYPHRVFVTESTTSLDDLLSIGIPKINVMLNPPGVDLHLYNLSSKTAKPSIVYFGGFRHYKRPTEVVYIFKDISDQLPDATLTFIGNGPDLEHVKSTVKDLKLTDKTRFTGRIETKELAEALSRCWLNVHTSVTEGWGLSILEASAAGTPTVAYSVPGVNDAIENGLNGIKVKDGDRSAFVRSAVSILNDPLKWQASSRKVAEKYSWDSTAKVWDKLIRDTVNGR